MDLAKFVKTNGPQIRENMSTGNISEFAHCSSIDVFTKLASMRPLKPVQSSDGVDRIYFTTTLKY